MHQFGQRNKKTRHTAQHILVAAMTKPVAGMLMQVSQSAGQSKNKKTRAHYKSMVAMTNNTAGMSMAALHGNGQDNTA